MIARAAALALAAVATVPSPVPAAFERLPLFPRPAALGGLVATSGDAVFGNPAAGPAGPRLSVRVAGARPFGWPELREEQAEARLRTGPLALGVGLRRFGTAVYAEKEARAVVSWAPGGVPARGAPGPWLAGGVAVRGLSVEGPGFESRRGLTVDAGLRAWPAPGTGIGAVIEGVLGRAPAELRRTSIGIWRALGARLRIHLETQRREDRPLGAVIGLAWRPSPAFEGLAGVRSEPPELSAGAVLAVSGVSVEAAATFTEALGRTVRVGLSLGVSKATNE